MMPLTLSVVIPTHNRAQDVLENLSALLPQCDGKSVEVIVVDSASGPADAAILTRLQGRPGVTVIRLDEPGLSRARNAGIARTSGEWLAFLDDDAVPRPDWLEVALKRIAVSGEDVGFVAGRVLPRWPSALPDGARTPAQIGPRWRMLLSIVDDVGVYRSTDRPLGVGANLLARRAALEAVGGFPTNMGRIGTSLASGEDPYVMDRIVAEGYECWYDGTLVVGHKIHGVRLTRPWAEERARQEGAVTLGKIGSGRARAATAAKAAASLPCLAALRLLDSREAEYFIRFSHNLGLLGTYLHLGLVEQQRVPADGLRSSRRMAQG